MKVVSLGTFYPYNSSFPDPQVNDLAEMREWVNCAKKRVAKPRPFNHRWLPSMADPGATPASAIAATAFTTGWTEVSAFLHVDGPVFFVPLPSSSSVNFAVIPTSFQFELANLLNKGGCLDILRFSSAQPPQHTRPQRRTVAETVGLLQVPSEVMRWIKTEKPKLIFVDDVITLGTTIEAAAVKLGVDALGITLGRTRDPNLPQPQPSALEPVFR